MLSVDPVAAAAGVLLLVAVVGSKASGRLGVPAVLLFLVVGMLAGSDGVGGIAFDDVELAQGVGAVALALILFAGGLDTDTREIRPVLGRGLLLATAGVVVTAGLVGLTAVVVVDLPVRTGLLLGAIVSSTDAAAVFSVLRARGVGLRAPIRPLLELESGSNDPMAVFLTVGLVELITQPDTAVASLLPRFVLQMGLGATVGVVVAAGTVTVINRSRLAHDGLYPVLTVGAVLLAYGLAAVLGGSGFLAVYVAGLAMSRAGFLHKRSLATFHDALAWLMQVAMFLLLGLLVFPSELVEVAGPALLLSAVLVLVARPVAVLGVLLPTRVPLRTAAMVSWVGLRGAVPIILATYPLVEGVEHGDVIFDVVFFVVLTSVLVQGTTIPVVARLLGVERPEPATPPHLLDAVQAAGGGAGLHQLTVPDASPVVGRQVVDLALPADVLIVLLRRAETFVVPQGRTVLEAGDEILVLADTATLAALHGLLGMAPS